MRIRGIAAICCSAIALIAAAGGPVEAKIPYVPPPAPVSVTMTGPKSVRVRVAAGTAAPCDSSANTRLFEGKVKPNWGDTWWVSTACICVEQTYDDFPDVDWGPARIECRPMVMGPYGWVRSNDPIFVSLTSTRPGK